MKRMRNIHRALIILMAASLAIPASGSVIYVRPTGRNTNAGSSWATAKLTVQAAIDAASSGSEVWVASGTYVQCITLKAGVSVYGGFAATETLRTQRKPATYSTYLDGGAAGSVVTAPTGASAMTVIDGFTIRNGRGSFGGGICAINSAITVSGNTISGNKGLYYGGGVYAEKSTVVVNGNTISGNSAPFGAGIACFDGASPSITGNVIKSNTASYDGSGIYCYHNSSPVISSNVVSGNSAGSEGAGLYCDDASPTIVSNTICSNSATANGGGLACLDASPVVVNNIVALGNSGIRASGAAVPSMRGNCMYGNTAYSYSGVAPGVGDLTSNPSFADAAAGDYHLVASSPLVNAGWNEAPGLPVTDMDGQPRIMSGAIDVGADEVAGLPPALTTFGQAKSASDNTWVSVAGPVVTAAWSDVFYVESDSRAGGIRVEKPGHAFAQGQRVSVEGIVKTNDDGERYIAPLAVGSTGNGSIEPLMMNNAFVGGGGMMLGGKKRTAMSGINNVGLLVKTSGVVTYIDAHSFWLDDGAAVALRCVTSDGVTVSPSWSRAIVTGVASCEKRSGQIYRLLRVRGYDDIQTY